MKRNLLSVSLVLLVVSIFTSCTHTVLVPVIETVEESLCEPPRGEDNTGERQTHGHNFNSIPYGCA